MSAPTTATARTGTVTLRASIKDARTKLPSVATDMLQIRANMCWLRLNNEDIQPMRSPIRAEKIIDTTALFLQI